MALMYEITGYDRETGRLVVAYEIPENEVSAVKQMAGVRSTDDGLGSYPLDAKQLAEIARAIRAVIPELVDTDYFLEPYEQTPRLAG